MVNINRWHSPQIVPFTMGSAIESIINDLSFCSLYELDSEFILNNSCLLKKKKKLKLKKRK